MGPKMVVVVRLLAIALFVIPVVLAVFMPDGAIWGGGKGGKG